jgi:hypothetical protein
MYTPEKENKSRSTILAAAGPVVVTGRRNANCSACIISNMPNCSIYPIIVFEIRD